MCIVIRVADANTILPLKGFAASVLLFRVSLFFLETREHVVHLNENVFLLLR